MQVRNILRNQAMCTPETNIQKVVKLMIENNSYSIPVVESLAHKNPIGVITEKSICRRSIGEGLNPLKMNAGRAMNCDYRKVSPDTSLDDCIGIMESNRIEYILVCDEDNVCCGLVTYDEIKNHLTDHKTFQLFENKTKQAEIFSFSGQLF